MSSPHSISKINNLKGLSWTSAYPELHSIDDAAWLQIANAAISTKFPENYTLFEDGDVCNNYLLIINGSVKVKKTTTDGHEIILYHIKKGQTCELTTCCLLSGTRYSAQAVTETPVEAIFISRNEFEKALNNSRGFRDFIFRTLDQGVEDLISLVENIAFIPTHQRLAKYLLDQYTIQHPIEATHHSIANELGTAREVVSRLLKEFERHGWIRLQRGSIEILSKKSLREIK